MPIIGSRMATATPETRQTLMGIAGALANTGKIAMATLLVTGILVLWLKWNWVIPNYWFWAKMGFVVLMIVFISLNEATTKRAEPGDPEAGRRSKMFGQLTALSFLGVILSAVFAFN
jgi:uncharacterized membrane protein